MLFIGPRGIGKTHLLSCIEDTVQSDEALSDSVVVVRFPEESNQTRSFADFLIGVCQILKDVLEGEPQWTDLFARVQTEEDNTRVVDTWYPQFANEIANATALCLSCLKISARFLPGKSATRTTSRRYASFSMADNGCLLLATAPLYFDGITDIGQPFYDFFDFRSWRV